MQNTTEFINYLNKHSKILIVGKGQFSHSINLEKYDLFIGIKQSIGILPRKDVLFMNDLEGLFGIEPYIKDIKYIVFPNAPHIASKPDKRNHKTLTDYLKIHNFKGKIINFEIHSNPRAKRDTNLIFVPNITNSGEISLFFLNQCQNRQNMNIFILGMYTSIYDNPKISNNISICKPHHNYLSLYNSYIYRIYSNKIKQNTKMINVAADFNKKYGFCKNVQSENAFVIVRSAINNKYSDLNIKFFK
tara:strand:+ start:128 stop:865 length:738 start_codon:yes stop_codon:yes gene_type:complete